MAELSDLTIVMPTYNRQDYALRNMRYWSGKGPAVHVLDGSSHPIYAHQLLSLSPNIFYHHLPISINARLSKAITDEMVTTEYAILLGDDEFHLPSGLKKCMDRLENSDLVACLGRCLYFEITEDKDIFSYPWIAPHTSFEGYTLLSNDPRERLLKHMNPYLCTTIYAVTKADVWKVNVMAAITETSTIDASEIAYEMACAYQGKSAVIDVLTWLRSGENATTNAPRNKKTLPNYKWMTQNDYASEKEVYVEDIEKALAESERLEEFLAGGQVRKDILDAMDAFVVCSQASFDNRWVNFTRYITRLISNARNLLTTKLPLSWVAYIKKIKHSLEGYMGVERPMISSGDLSEMARAWGEGGISYDESEIQEIQDIILDFHQTIN